MAADDPMTEGARHPLAWLPNALTMARVALAPAILLALIGPALATPGPLLLTPWTAPAGGLLALAGLLDWLDGRLARAWKAESAFGRFWDPVADKLVIGAGLIGGAVAFPSTLLILPAALLLWRDALVTWLRTRPEHAAITAAPSILAKWKTALEYAALLTLFFATAAASGLGGLGPAAQTGFVVVGLVALWVAAGLSLWTAWGYVRRTRAQGG